MKRYSIVVALALYIGIIAPQPAYAMHISEGILPLPWAGLWYIIALPFVAKGISTIKKNSREVPAFVPLVGMASAAVFIISAMPIPIPIAGTCSHPAGTGLTAIMIGPFASIVATSVALLIQALFLAHGGITTWGADIFAMGVIGSFSGYFTFKALTKLKLPLTVAAFVSGLMADWATYATTALELALGLSGQGSAFGMFQAILIAFIPTQLPLGILEGFATAGFFAFILKRRPDILMKLNIIPSAHGIQEDAAHENPAY